MASLAVNGLFNTCSAISHLFIHQLKEREAMKDERTYHGAMDKSWSEQ